MNFIKSHVSWYTAFSVGSKVAVAGLLWLGFSMRDASLIVAAPFVYVLYRIFKGGMREQYLIPIDRLYGHIQEGKKQWVWISNSSDEAPTSESRVDFTPQKSRSTPGPSSAPTPTATSPFLPIRKNTLWR